EHDGDIAGQRRHRIVAGHRVAAAMPAHVEAQHAETSLQQRRDLLGPAAAVGSQRMGDADDRAVFGPGEVVIEAASLKRQQHGMSSLSDGSGPYRTKLSATRRVWESFPSGSRH